MRTLIFLLLWSSATWAMAPSEQARVYGQQAEFDAFRNDQPVGRYRLSFSQDAGVLEVQAEMELGLKVLGFIPFSYRYTAVERWQGDQLISLEAVTDRNGDQRRISGRLIEAEGQPPQLRVIDKEGQAQLIEPEVITTNHWRAAILTQHRVLNTLTGELSELDVQSLGEERWEIDNKPLRVQRYQLGGDLKTTQTWYDLDGRWRGLQFEARDGSTIRIISAGARPLTERLASYDH